MPGLILAATTVYLVARRAQRAAAEAALAEDRPIRNDAEGMPTVFAPSDSEVPSSPEQSSDEESGSEDSNANLSSRHRPNARRRRSSKRSSSRDGREQNGEQDEGGSERNTSSSLISEDARRAIDDAFRGLINRSSFTARFVSDDDSNNDKEGRNDQLATKFTIENTLSIFLHRSSASLSGTENTSCSDEQEEEYSEQGLLLDDDSDPGLDSAKERKRNSSSNLAELVENIMRIDDVVMDGLRKSKRAVDNGLNTSKRVVGDGFNTSKRMVGDGLKSSKRVVDDGLMKSKRVVDGLVEQVDDRNREFQVIIKAIPDMMFSSSSSRSSSEGTN